MKQKFGKLTFVHVCKDMPVHMKHFESDFDAIVCGTYSQIYGGNDINSYSLYVIENGKVVNSISWYKEYQIIALEDHNYKNAEEMIEEYNLQGE